MYPRLHGDGGSKGECLFHDTPWSYTLFPNKTNPPLPFQLHRHWTFTFIHQHLWSPNPTQGDIFQVAVSQDLIAACSPFLHTHLHVWLFKDILPAEV